MNKENYLLVCLMEEAAEIGQAAAKGIRFGLDDYHPDREHHKNHDELLEEYYQTVAIIEMLQEESILKKLSLEEIECVKQRKKKKVIEYMTYSKEKGQLH